MKVFSLTLKVLRNIPAYKFDSFFVLQTIASWIMTHNTNANNFNSLASPNKQLSITKTKNTLQISKYSFFIHYVFRANPSLYYKMNELDPFLLLLLTRKGRKL